MRAYFMLMLVPGMQMGKFMHGSNQESVGVQIVIYGYAVPLAIKRGTIIPKFTVAVTRYFKLAFKIINLPAN